MTDLMQVISTLPVDEKLKLIEAIRADIEATPKPIELSEELKAELDRRIAECREEDYIDEAELWRRVDGRVAQ